MIKYRKKANNSLHKLLKITLFTVMLVSFLSVDCLAAEKESEEMIKEGVDQIIEDFKGALPDGEGGEADMEQTVKSLGIKHILENVCNEIEGHSTEIASFLLVLLGVGMISSLASLHTGELGALSSRAVGITVSALIFERLVFLVRGAVSSLGEIDSFFAAVIPICISVNSLGASPTTAETQALGMGLTLGIYAYISKKLILPIVSSIFVTSAASSIDPLFGRIAKSVRDVFLWGMGILTALVGATFSLQSVISASADSAVMRGARYAISGTIPIVGSSVSGALGLVAGGASYARGIVGGGSIAVIIALIISPIITLLLYRLALRLGIFFFSLASLDGSSGILSSFLYAIDSALAAYSFTSVIYVIELVAFLKGGASLA